MTTLWIADPELGAWEGPETERSVPYRIDGGEVEIAVIDESKCGGWRGGIDLDKVARAIDVPYDKSRWSSEQWAGS